MHQLKRPAAPKCLGRYRHGRDRWDDVSRVDKSRIRTHLDAMQQSRCAYCEDHIEKGLEKRNSHIEHFRQRSRYPQGTFEWDNLFASCNKQNSCGNHKDRLPPYPPGDLIKMDEENPDDFFIFVMDGTIALRPDLTGRQRHRAKETLRIFNLDAENGPLRHMRKAAVQGYIQTAEEITEMALQFNEEDWLPLLEEELGAIKSLPFATAVRHLLIPC